MSTTDTDLHILHQLIEKHGTPGPWITTYSGQRFHFLHPDIYFSNTPDSDILTDLAVPLSKEPRFGGHNHGIWSVAAHSIFVHRVVKTFYPASSRDLYLGSLLHDAHEATLKDVMRPLKTLFGPEYKALAHLIQSAYHDHFTIYLDIDEEEVIKIVDVGVLKTEAAAMMKNFEDWTFEDYKDIESEDGGSTNYLATINPAPRNLFPIRDYHPDDIAKLFLTELKEYVP